MLRVLIALACLFVSLLPAAAMVGGAPPAGQSIARHVVLIVGGAAPAPASRSRPTWCSPPRTA